jgi:hypothetical protein
MSAGPVLPRGLSHPAETRQGVSGKLSPIRFFPVYEYYEEVRQPVQAFPIEEEELPEIAASGQSQPISARSTGTHSSALSGGRSACQEAKDRLSPMLARHIRAQCQHSPTNSLRPCSHQGIRWRHCAFPVNPPVSTDQGQQPMTSAPIPYGSTSTNQSGAAGHAPFHPWNAYDSPHLHADCRAAAASSRLR